MELKVTIHTNDEEHTKEVLERLVSENIENKLDSYLKKFEAKVDAEWELILDIEKNKKDSFNGSLRWKFDSKDFHFSREDFIKLDDLVNHLFDKLKLELSK